MVIALKIIMMMLIIFLNFVATPISHAEGNKVILNAPIIKQNPELYNGCEVTSLAMLLRYAKIPVSKMKLAQELKKDIDPLHEKNGDITHWGNPDHGFVGDITGKKKGYGVHDKPLEHVMKRYLPKQTLNLTGSSMDILISQIKDRKPVIVWTTVHYNYPRKWEYWNHKGKRIKATFDMHAVLLVGYEPQYVYINDPLSGEKAKRISTKTFLSSWNALGSKALSYR